jgi:2-polyprenyl-3-methyl-5-hydroxy-6-metoxy-1,4-benzoquinol methylase
MVRWWNGYPARSPLSQVEKLFFTVWKPFIHHKAGYLIPAHVANGRLLEIGCSRGSYLLRMRQLGWQGAGLDIDLDLLSHVHCSYGLDVHQAEASQLPFGDEQFDVVHLAHTIEHLADPLAVLREVRRVLKPAGCVLLSTPNVESLGRRVLQEYWSAFAAPLHLVLFTPQSLRWAVECAGLAVEHLATPATDSDRVFFRTAAAMLNLTGRTRDAVGWACRLLLVVEWALAVLGLKLGEELQVVARRV